MLPQSAKTRTTDLHQATCPMLYSPFRFCVHIISCSKQAFVTLEVLHDVLQVAMGWYDSYLHEFRIGQKRFGKPDPEDGLMGMPPVINENRYALFLLQAAE
jgi:hypothetical protein